VRLVVKALVLLVVLCVVGGGLAAAVPGYTIREKGLWLDRVRTGGTDVFLGVGQGARKPARSTGKTGKVEQASGKKLVPNRQVANKETSATVKPVGKNTRGATGIITGDKRAQAIEQEVFKLLNETRRAAGVPPVEWFEPIAKMAREKSRDAFETGELTHFSKRLGDCTDMYDRAGLRYVAADEVACDELEQVVNVKEVAQGMIRSWLTSPPHRKTILNKELKMAGVGVAWSESPVPIEAKVGIKSLGVADTYAVCFILFITLADGG